jgi:rare lipoprotein A
MTRCIASASIALAFSLACAGAQAQHARTFSGMASFYSESGKTAEGKRYDPSKFTAAHRTLPFGTRLRVTNARNNQTVTVVVNDRGPFVKGRVLDLSVAAAKALHMTSAGVARVNVSIE